MHAAYTLDPKLNHEVKTRIHNTIFYYNYDDDGLAMIRSSAITL